MGSARFLKSTEQLAPGVRYELLAHLESGSMGTVYAGRSVVDGASQNLVAIKRAHRHLVCDRACREMFLDEARFAARVHHPNVVAVREVVEADGELCIVMEYVEGVSLAELLGECLDARQRLPAPVALRIILDAAAGLHAAHSARLVHRDVSPHNVLVGLDGVSRIIDFGVATAIDPDMLPAKTEGLKGTVAYMAPEYLDGRQASPTSDVFSLGVVAWEAIAMRRLFRAGDDVLTMQRITSPDLAPPLSDAVSIDAGVDAAIAKALSKDPSARCASANDFAVAVTDAARKAHLLATPPDVAAAVVSLMGADLAATRAIIGEALTLT